MLPFSSISDIRRRYRLYKRRNGSLGFKIRSKMARLEKKLGPYMLKLFPSFIHAHYAYITFCAIIGSILIYPQKNMPYIDALFMASGAATQAGLNTVNLNDATLFQQMSIYCMCFLTTPIFIHGSILFLRLYWFEKTFDDIKTTSKLHHKMRRTATLLAINSQQTNDRLPRAFSSASKISKKLRPAFSSSNDMSSHLPLPTEANSGSRSSPESNKEVSSSNSSSNNNDLNNNLNDISHPRTEPKVISRKVISRVDSDDIDARVNYNDIHHLSEPSDSENDLQEIKRSPDERLQDGNDRDIKFADNLPHPNRRHTDIEPQDMYMSIAMMQKNHKLHHPDNDNDEDGPALVISGPLERERKRRKRIGHRHRKPHISKFKYDQNVDENIDDVEMNAPSRRRSMIQFKVPTQVSLIRSKSGSFRPPWNRPKSEENALTDDEDVSINSDDQGDGSDNDDEEEDEDDEDYHLSKAQTNLAIPSSDQTGGLKYNKRANTLDVNPMRRQSLFTTSPTFDKFFRSKGAKRHRKKSRRHSSTVFDEDDEEDSDDARSSNPRNPMSGNYLSWTPTVARNSTFVSMTEDQKEELGGVEYRAVKLLCKIVLLYYVGFHIIAVICYLPFILKKPHYSHLMREDGISPTWWGFFTPASVFNDLGYTLNPDSMFPFYKSTYILLISGFFIIIGNTGFPVFLRFIIWIMFKLSKQLSLFKESLGFLLDHPRRCFTLLFPSVPTWWLFFILIALNAIDLVLFIILDLKNPSLTSIPVGNRVVDGLFQAFSTRTAGLTVVDLSKLHPSVQVSYMLMMYISVLPLAISIRRTNVYEEQSLGIYGGSQNSNDPDSNTHTFVATHLRNQLSFDLWFIFLGLFIICIADGSKLQKNNTDFTVFQVLFEIVSAYGTVGLSLGYPNTNTSFSAQFSVISKLVIIAMMIRGRHRGLPYSLDRAIILPSDKMNLIDKLQEKYGHSSRLNTMNTAETRTKTNIFNTVKTLQAGIFNIGGPANPTNWIDSRLPRNTNSHHTGHSTHHPENITFSLRNNGPSNNVPLQNLSSVSTDTTRGEGSEQDHDNSSIRDQNDSLSSLQRNLSPLQTTSIPAHAMTRRGSF